jgi:tetratricopeptide (TPR) repeat protein
MVEEIRPRAAITTGPGRLAALLPLVLIIWGFVAVYLLQLSIDGVSKSEMREEVVQDLVYFPSGDFLREATIEYQNVASDAVWLRAIQYYGHHLMTDRKYEWLGHVFEILTALDPHFIGAYHFGAITLAWDAGKPREATRLLVEGMKANPMNWQLPFDAGFISYMLLGDYETAAAFFEVTAKLPDAWLVASRWAAVARAKAGDFDTARDMWLEIYHGTENQQLRRLVVRQLRLLILEEALGRLQEAVSRFREDRGFLPSSIFDLIRAGYVERIPEEPYGGRFYLDNGRVRSTTPPSQRG